MGQWCCTLYMETPGAGTALRISSLLGAAARFQGEDKQGLHLEGGLTCVPPYLQEWQAGLTLRPWTGLCWACQAVQLPPSAA